MALKIDRRYQGLGSGRDALQLLLNHVQARSGAKAFCTGCLPGERSPCAFSETMGLGYTGEEDDGELVLRLDL